MKNARIEVGGEREMEELGAKLVRDFLAERRAGKPAVGGGDADGAIVIQLVGDLGAGKTTLTRGMARGLGIDAPITSPTFQVHKEYTSKYGKTGLHHFDFYRLQDLGVMKSELEELLADEKNVVVIEWGGILGDLAENAKIVKIEKLTDEKRALLLE
jgi:tRNA threonylcarbamoyladenosine biosynthesis protein TsaE